VSACACREGKHTSTHAYKTRTQKHIPVSTHDTLKDAHEVRSSCEFLGERFS